MKKIILSKEQIFELVSENRYRVDEKTKFFSRCIDGRYAPAISNFQFPISKQTSNFQKPISKINQLPALAFPGADVGELTLLFATANVYGFEVDREKAVESLLEVVGGEKNFGLHSGRHGDPQVIASDCGHYKTIKRHPEAYQIEKDQIDFIDQALIKMKKKGAKEIILEGEHLEGAILMVRGDWGILPRYKLQFEGGANEVQVFVYHQSLVDERHRVLASTLLRRKAVKLFKGCGVDYLYQVLSEMAENHLMETAKRLAKGLPIYQTNFEKDGGFEIKEMGKV